MMITRTPKKIYKPKILAKDMPGSRTSHSLSQDGRVAITVGDADPDYHYSIETTIGELERILENLKLSSKEYES